MRSGATIWLTGPPAAGKTTLAGRVSRKMTASRVIRIDGDDLRRTISHDLDFGREGRRENCRRATELALDAARSGAIAIVALVSPYAADRSEARVRHEAESLMFIEVYVATPIAECRRRDPKGLYSLALSGAMTGMTGVDDPYEPPQAPDVRIELGDLDLQVRSLVDQLELLLGPLTGLSGSASRGPG